jgi:DNA-binding PadR family transcriptional regulator
MAEPRLTTTAYAILGVLAIQPRTAYELATEMRHCFEYFWPRDDVRVYADAKALAAAGLARSERTMIGRRPRTTYAITPRGRAALRRWLRQPSRPVALEFEGLVKVYLARFGTLATLRATVEQVGRDAEYMLQVATNVRHVYLEGCAPFQDEYVHVWSFVYDFLSSWFQMLAAWARRTVDELAEWEDLAPDDKRRRALELFERKRPFPGMRPDMEAAVDGVPAIPGMWRRRQAP